MVASLVDTSLGDGTVVSDTASANAPIPSAASTTKMMMSPRTQCRFGCLVRPLAPEVGRGLTAFFAGWRGVLKLTSLTGKVQASPTKADLGLHEITGDG